MNQKISGSFEIFPSSKIDFWPFFKLQKMEIGKKKIFREIKNSFISRVFLWGLDFFNFLAHYGHSGFSNSLNFPAVKQQQQNGSGSGTVSASTAASAAHKVARQIMDEEAATTSPGMARSPAMHQGFRQEEWVVERTPVNTPDDKVVLVGKCRAKIRKKLLQNELNHEKKSILAEQCTT